MRPYTIQTLMNCIILQLQSLDLRAASGQVRLQPALCLLPHPSQSAVMPTSHIHLQEGGVSSNGSSLEAQCQRCAAYLAAACCCTAALISTLQEHSHGFSRHLRNRRPCMGELLCFQLLHQCRYTAVYPYASQEQQVLPAMAVGPMLIGQ